MTEHDEPEITGDEYRKVSWSTVRARKWDGTQAGAGDVIEWIQAHGGTAEFLERNETRTRLNPWVAIYGSASEARAMPIPLIGYMNPSDFVIANGVGQFMIMSAENFTSQFEKVAGV